MDQIAWALLIGSAIGILTRVLTSATGPGGSMGEAISVGIVGAVAATSIAHRLFSQGTRAGWLLSGIGATVLCWAWTRAR